jgi:hypothetical protein
MPTQGEFWREYVAKVPRKPETYEWDIEDLKTGREYTVAVLFNYYPAYPGVMNPPDRAQPPEPAEVEIVGIEYVAGAVNDVEWEMACPMIEHVIMDEESDEHQRIVEAIHEHVDSEQERLMAGEYS